MKYLFWIFLTFLTVQRILELLLAKKNEKTVRKIGAIEYDVNGYKAIVLMHIAFFILLILEKILLNRQLNDFSPVLFLIFLLAQVLRYWAIKSLGIYWNTRILVIPKSSLIKQGPYKYLKHPNYVAVITEIAVIPLIFSCYITSILFSIINLMLLRRRIEIEEKALNIS